MRRSVRGTLAAGAVVVLAPLPGLAGAAGAQTPPPPTDDCPYALTPAPAIDASEVPAPGEAAPAPLLKPAPPVGGSSLGACGVVLPAGAPELPPDLSASGWAVTDADAGTVLAAKDPHGRYRSASTIKVLLAQVALANLPLDREVTALPEDDSIEGSRVGIGRGGVYTVEQLLQGLVMASGNDAAHMLARELGGDEAAVAQMNALAARLGGSDTRVVTPSGLDAPGGSTSAYDLTLFLREGLRNPEFKRLLGTEKVMFPGHPKNPDIPDDVDHPAFELDNDNRMLTEYPGSLGGKNGYTDDARHTYVGAAQRDSRTLVVSIVGAEVAPLRAWQQASRLLDYAYALPPGTAAVGAMAEPGPAPASAVSVASAPIVSRPGTGAGTVTLRVGGAGVAALAAFWLFRTGLVTARESSRRAARAEQRRLRGRR